MKFMLTFAIKPEIKGRDQAIARFKQTGGATRKAEAARPLDGADFSGGFALHRERATSPRSPRTRCNGAT